VPREQEGIRPAFSAPGRPSATDSESEVHGTGPCAGFDPEERNDVSDLNLIAVSDAADEAFQGFDWTEHDGKGVRLFIQGFG